MELKQFLHMNDGNGELSYYKNSSVQKEVWLMNQSMFDNAINSLLLEEDAIFLEGLNVADLGCGVGPVPVAFVTRVIEIMQMKCKELKHGIGGDKPKIQIYMNDLPSNDFNLLFRELLNLEVLNKKNNEMLMCFLMGVPGSYYERIVPHKCLHFVHASYCIHWFSKVPEELRISEKRAPINKGNVYISDSSSKVVANVYMAQFEEDFTQFLECRSQEVVPKGRMLLTVRGRPISSDPFTWQPWELKLFTKALSCLVFEGLIKEENLDTFNFPYYCASEEQLEYIVKKQGSFAIESTKTMGNHDIAHEIKDKWERSLTITKIIRAFTEPLILRHFGEDIVDLVYNKIALYALEFLDHGQLPVHHHVSILLKKH